MHRVDVYIIVKQYQFSKDIRDYLLFREYGAMVMYVKYDRQDSTSMPPEENLFVHLEHRESKPKH